MPQYWKVSTISYGTILSVILIAYKSCSLNIIKLWQKILTDSATKGRQHSKVLGYWQLLGYLIPRSKRAVGSGVGGKGWGASVFDRSANSLLAKLPCLESAVALCLLNLYQPGGAHYPRPVLQAPPPWFSYLETALQELRVPWITSFSNIFSLFQLEKAKKKYKKCSPYYMVSIQKILLGKNSL